MIQLQGKPTLREINTSPLLWGLSLFELITSASAGLLWITYTGHPFRAAFYTALGMYLLKELRGKRLRGTGKALGSWLLQGSVWSVLGTCKAPPFPLKGDPYTIEELRR